MKLLSLVGILALGGCASTSSTYDARLAEAERRITALEEQLAQQAPPAPNEAYVPPPNEYSPWVMKTGAYDYTVNQEALRVARERLQSEARVVPHYRDNSYAGVKLVGVRPGSLYRALGIRSGDVITVINGVTLDSPTKVLGIVEAIDAGQVTNVVVEILRRGEPKTLTYTIER
jgi:S1-C subfamily serine protease